MDVFLLEGMEIIFKVALALLTIAKDNILSLDMEGMLKVRRLILIHMFVLCHKFSSSFVLLLKHAF